MRLNERELGPARVGGILHDKVSGLMATYVVSSKRTGLRCCSFTDRTLAGRSDTQFRGGAESNVGSSNYTVKIFPPSELQLSVIPYN